MARATFEGWLPEEKSSEVITKVSQNSAIETLARSLPMKSSTKSFPRSGGVDVEMIAKGGIYGEDVSANDEITLTAKKFGKAVRIAEEDLDDSAADILTTKKSDWATSYAKFIDNATLAVTAAVGAGVPFVSVYRAVRTADASVGYTADDNYFAAGEFLDNTVTLTDAGDLITTPVPHGLAIGDSVIFGAITTTTGITAGVRYYVLTVPSSTTFTVSATKNGATLALTTNGSAAGVQTGAQRVSYDNLSDALGLIEESDYFDEGRIVAIAHPSFKAAIRRIKDDNGDPIFVSNPREGSASTLFGYPLKWSLGARTSSVATSTPSGNPLLIFANRDLLYLGKRSGPESVVIDGRDGLSALTDETILKMRARRAFALAQPSAAVVYELFR